MLSYEELKEYLIELEEALDRFDRLQVLQRLYRKAYVHGCNDSGNSVKE